jgi:hypothetical protein
MSEKEAGIEVQGRVEESSGGMYRVKIDTASLPTSIRGDRVAT